MRTLDGSLSAVSEPIFVIKYRLCVVCASSQTRSTFRFSSYGAASVEQGCASRGGETRSDTSVSASLTPDEPRGCLRALSFRQDPPFGILR